VESPLQAKGRQPQHTAVTRGCLSSLCKGSSRTSLFHSAVRLLGTDFNIYPRKFYKSRLARLPLSFISRGRINKRTLYRVLINESSIIYWQFLAKQLGEATWRNTQIIWQRPRSPHHPANLPRKRPARCSEQRSKRFHRRGIP